MTDKLNRIKIREKSLSHENLHTTGSTVPSDNVLKEV